MMKTRNQLIAILIVIPVLLSSCKKDNLGISQVSLTGLWLEKESSIIIQFEGTNHLFQLNADKTFMLKRDFWTDIIVSDSCYGSHTDNVLGTYSFTNNHFEFVGKYSDKFFNIQQMNNCGETDFNYTTPYKYKDGVLTLNSNEDVYYQIALYKQ